MLVHLPLAVAVNRAELALALAVAHHIPPSISPSLMADLGFFHFLSSGFIFLSVLNLIV